ncbi:MAG: pirin family protein [Legionellales bacterium]
MINIRKSQERGTSRSDWLTSYHSFSFADYYDPLFMGFGHLRVINEDTIMPGGGFGKHPHRDMEIITYVIDGALEHKDSLGTGSIIRPGEIQRMSAGKGVAHSEFNHSGNEKLHLLQIWIVPETTQLEPSYEQKVIAKTNNQLILIASGNPTSAAVRIHQDVSLSVGYFTKGNSLSHHLPQGRCAWFQLIKGKITMNHHQLLPGDGAAIYNESNIEMVCTADAEFLFFDLLEL